MLGPTLLAVAATAYLVVRIVLTLRATDARSAGPIAVAFAPPPELTPGTAARLLRGTNDRSGVTAEVIDLAVKGVWRLGVRDVGGTATWFVQRDQPYEPILGEMPQAVYRAVFARGDMALSRNFVPDERRSEAMVAASIMARRIAEKNGWIRRHKQRYLVLNLLGQALIAAAIGIPVLAAYSATGAFVDPDGPTGLPFLIYGGTVGFVAQFVGIKPWTLTPQGRLMVDQLEGLRRYMTLPDRERRAALEAPDGAARRPVPVSGAWGVDGSAVVALHERLLPYAVLFDIVPEWVDVVRADHERAGTTPAWVVGGGHDAAAAASVFASMEGVGGLRRLGS